MKFDRNSLRKIRKFILGFNEPTKFKMSEQISHIKFILIHLQMEVLLGRVTQWLQLGGSSTASQLIDR